jgi:hypothetical protein
VERNEGPDRAAFRSLIHDNIVRHGVHVTAVSGGAFPGFGYTIGLLAKPFGAELVYAGGCSATSNEISTILNHAAAQLADELRTENSVTGSASFGLRAVHESWQSQLLLGVYDYFDTDSFSAFQVTIPDAELDIETPDLSRAYDPATEPIWQWLREPWPYAIPKSTWVMTNRPALQGHTIDRVCLWDDGFEMVAESAGPIDPDDGLLVRLSTLLALDPTLEPVLALAVDQCVRRTGPGTAWKPWT